MRHDYSGRFGRVRLAPLAQGDTEKLRVLRNQNSSRFIDAAQISRSAQEQWYETYLKKAGDYMFSVHRLSDGTWIGAAGIYGIVPTVAAGEFGRLILDREAAGGSGFGVDVTKAACIIAFSQLHVDKLKLEVYHDNIPALITYLKSGFLPVKMAEDSKLVQMELVRTEEMSYGT